MGAIGVVVLTAVFFPAVGPLAALGAGVVATIGAFSGLGVVGGLAAVGKKFNIFDKIMPSGDYFQKLKISDINKFAKLKTFTKLIVDGKINLANQEDMKKVTSKSLYRALNGSKTFLQAISDEEGYLILGEDYGHIKKLKEEQVEEKAEELLRDKKFKETNKQKEGESDKEYEERLKKLAKTQAEIGFDWNIASIAKIMDALHYEKGSAKQEKLFVALLGDANINSEDMVKRYIKVSDMKEIVDSSVDIRALQNYKMFNEDNSVSNEFISTYVKPELILRRVDNKFERNGYKGAKAGEELVGKMGVGFTKAEELNVAIAQTLALFESTRAMYEYLGLDSAKEHTKEEIAGAAFATYKEALSLFAAGEIDKAALEQEATIIRTVSEMLMVAIEKPELARVINGKNINNEELENIERMVNIESTRVNRYVFINALREEVKSSREEDRVFEIKIEDLKRGLESKEGLGNIELPKEIKDLLPELEGGNRGKKHKTMLMEIRNAKAVSQAA